MSSPTKERTSRRPAREERPLIPERYQHAAAVGGILLSLILFFGSVLVNDKTFIAADSIASYSFDTYLRDASAQGVFPLWNPYIFCGMPGYGSLTVTGNRWFDLSWFMLNKVQNAFGTIMPNFPVSIVLFYYWILGAGVYVLSLSKTRSRIAAFTASLATIYSTYIIIWIMSSHNTKIMCIAFVPWVFLMLEQLRERFSWWRGLVLVLLFHFIYGSTHVQMIYYVGLTVGLILTVEFVYALIRKADWKAVARTAAVAVIAAGVAFLMDADRYLSVLEYNPYSIRGSAPLIDQKSAADTKTKPGGLDYEYATAWSLAPGEMMTFIVPTWYGFGTLTYDGPLTSEPVKFNGYWGPQPFTDGAQYMGVVALALAFVGFFRYRRDPFVVALGILIVVSLLIAFGKEFPLLYDPLFSYLPMFNKFRVPAMILVLVQLAVPLLAAYGIASLLARREDAMVPAVERRWTRTLVGLGVVAASAVVLRGPLSSFYEGFFPLREVGGMLAQHLGTNQANVVSAFYAAVVATVVNDILFASLFLLAAFGAIFLYIRGRVGLTAASVVLVLAVTADLWRISRRPMDPKPKSDHEAIFAAPGYVRALQQDSTLFRTLTFQNGQPPYDNTLAYWRIQSAYGYQGAKMRAYQDMIEVAGIGNPLVWQLMNVKYIITNTPDTSGFFETVYRGDPFSVLRWRGALPRVFFVDRVETASLEQTLDHIANRTFDAQALAYVAADPGVRIDPPGSVASATVTRFGIQDLEVKVHATGSNMLFLSETYYPVGWKAMIDGNETPIHRLDYLFRGVVVPPGDHTLVMTFEPRGFILGRYLTIGANVVVLAGVGFFGLREWRKRNKMPENA